MALVRGPYSVAGSPANHDPHAFKKVVGTYDFPDDHVAPKKPWYATEIGAPNAHGSIVQDVGVITGINVGNAGSGYTVAPTVALTAPPTGGTQATATATVSATGTITAFTLTNPGSGYITAPTVTITAGSGGGSGGTATVVFAAGKAHVDASAALKVPGVKGVYWFENTGGFSSSWTNYGAAIAAVCAEDWDTAEYAATLIKIEVNALPVVATWAQALNPSTPNSGKSTANVVPGSTLTRPTTSPSALHPGTYDQTAALAASDKVIGPMQTGIYRTMCHNAIQPKTGMVWQNGTDWYCFFSSQGGANSGTTTINSVVPGGSNRNIHYSVHSSGGGFGDGESATWATMAARISVALNGHPIVMKLSRNATNHQASRQYDTDCNMTFGVKNDGTMVIATGLFQTGLGSGSSNWAGFQKTYKCPNISFTSNGIYYNAPGRGAWRCVQDEPGSQGWDIAMEHVAGALNMDAYDFRLKNLHALTDRDEENSLVFSNFSAPTCMKKAHDVSNYDAKKHLPGKGPARADGKKHGIAILGRYDSHGGVSGSGRYGHVILGPDGIAKLYHGSGCGSTGPQAAMMNVVAEVMGLAYQDVQLVAWGDSDLTYTAGGQNGSGHTGGAGTAYYMTALDLRQRVFARACTNTVFNSQTLASVTTKAAATATIANGSVVSFNITNGGAGYSAPPIVSVYAPNVTATATAVISSGAVTSITLTTPTTTAPFTGALPIGGCGYVIANPIVTIGAPPTGGTQALATATVTNGTVTSITIASGGSGYTSAPTVSIAAPSGTYVTAYAQSTIDASGKVVSIAPTAGVTTGFGGAAVGGGGFNTVGNIIPAGGIGYTTAPLVKIFDVTPNDLDAANSSIFLKSAPTATATTATYATICSGWSAQASIQTGWGSNLKWGPMGDAPIGSACNTSGAMGACAEVLVDPETGDVDIIGYWNVVETGTTLSQVSVMKEIGSGCEAAIGQALFYGDVFDPTTAACLQMAHGLYHHPTSMDFDPTTFYLYDQQSFDLAGPLGAHGMSEPASGLAASIQCAIYNATGNNFMQPNSGSCSQDIVLKSMGVV
jgi:CO/xanthine dehydrogenase Mo-binding subunit